MRKYVLLITAVGLLNACTHVEADPDAAVKEQARRFAEAYFNYDFIGARSFATPESEKWLRFAASNVTQEEVDVVNAAQKAAYVDVADCHYLNDSMAYVALIVYNVVLKDNIGQPAHMADEAEFTLTLVKRDDDHLVKMEGLPRNGKQSPDSTSDE